jgi:hypothetical protein
VPAAVMESVKGMSMFKAHEYDGVRLCHDFESASGRDKIKKTFKAALIFAAYMFLTPEFGGYQ